MHLKKIQLPSTREEQDRNFNSCDHKDVQYPPKLPTTPFHLTRWLPLIFADHQQDFILLDLKSFEIDLIKKFTTAGILSVRLNERSYEELAELGFQIGLTQQYAA